MARIRGLRSCASPSDTTRAALASSARAAFRSAACWPLSFSIDTILPVPMKSRQKGVVRLSSTA